MQTKKTLFREMNKDKTNYKKQILKKRKIANNKNKTMISMISKKLKKQNSN